MNILTKVLFYPKQTQQIIDWEAVFYSALPGVFNYFMYRTGDKAVAEDLTSETFEQAWKSRANYRIEMASPLTWLLGIGRNIFANYLRNNKHQMPLDQVERISDGFSIEQGFLHQQDKFLLRHLILDLPKREQELIALKYGAELTNREIARLTHLTESNVGTILHRTVKKLQDKWIE